MFGCRDLSCGKRMASGRFEFVLVTLCLVVLQSAFVTCSVDYALNRQTRAIGGQRFSRGQWPWLVLMRATYTTRRFLGIRIAHGHAYCGGVLVAPQWVVTAAHCFEGRSELMRASTWEARMATARVRPSLAHRVVDLLGRIINDDDFRQWEIDAVRIVIHPDYIHNRTTIANDIAMVKLEHPVPNVDSVRPIQLPNYGGPTFPQLGVNCTVTGWGCTAPGGGVATWGQQITMPILPDGVCQRYFNMNSMNGRICAGHSFSGVGVCMGDSGGPLVCRANNPNASSNNNNDDDDDNDNFVLAGIVSFASENNPQSYPAVFTKIQSFTPWMERVMNRF